MRTYIHSYIRQYIGTYIHRCVDGTLQSPAAAGHQTHHNLPVGITFQSQGNVLCQTSKRDKKLSAAFRQLTANLAATDDSSLRRVYAHYFLMPKGK